MFVFSFNYYVTWLNQLYMSKLSRNTLIYKVINCICSTGTMDALILDCGYHATHVMPVLGGQLQCRSVRRINMGGCQVDTFMQKLLQLKYPGHLNALTLSRAEVNIS